MTGKWEWENATAGSIAGFATVAIMHPLDVVRTRFQVNDGRNVNLPTYKNTPHALFTIARSEVTIFLFCWEVNIMRVVNLGEQGFLCLYMPILSLGSNNLQGLRGLYAGFLPAVLGSSVSWGLFFFFYSRAKNRYSRGREEKLSPGSHLAAAAEAGALVSLCTNPIWLIKTRLQLQNPLHQTRQYSGVYG